MNLRPGTINDIISEKISHDDGHLVVVTRYYPRYLRRKLIDEYICSLGPSKLLLADFKAAEKQVGHEKAFKKVNYVKRFKLTARAREELVRLKKLSEEKPVYLFCFCKRGEFCHRDILISMAKAI